MIVGVSGRIGSGKDTVAKIMQYLDYVQFMKNKLEERERMKYSDSVNILSFDEWMKPNIHKSGYDISGVSMYEVNNFGRAWQIKKWAGKLKEVATLLTGIPTENFEDQEFKKTEMGAMWGMSVREFLQKLGTEAMRDNLHKNVWVNALMSDYKVRKKEGGFQRVVKSNGIPIDFEYEVEYPNWIVSDTRFPNEAQAIKDNGGIVIRVNRPKKGIVVGNLAQELHPSETSLDDWNFDVVIENDGSIEDLIEKVKEVMDAYNL